MPRLSEGGIPMLAWKMTMRLRGAVLRPSDAGKLTESEAP
jgi:hypothetical protein